MQNALTVGTIGAAQLDALHFEVYRQLTSRTLDTVIIRTHSDLLKKLSAALAMVLMLHTQIAWACANVGVDRAVSASCCAEHTDMATDRMSHCNDSSGDALCAKPIAHSVSPSLSQAHNDARSSNADSANDAGGDLFAVIAFADAAAVFARLDLSPHVADPYETLALGRLTYLKTLRLRI